MPFYTIPNSGSSGVTAKIYNLTGVGASEQIRVHSTLYSLKLKRQLELPSFVEWLLSGVEKLYILEDLGLNSPMNNQSNLQCKLFICPYINYN